MIIEIPGYKTLDLDYLVLDYNGTIAVGAWFGLMRAGRQSGEIGVDRYFEQQISLKSVY